jgi:hypothetical protein
LSGILKESKEILCSRGIIVAVQVGAVKIVKIYLAAEEALRKKERQGETQEPSKLMFFFFEFQSPLNANKLFCF